MTEPEKVGIRKRIYTAVCGFVLLGGAAFVCFAEEAGQGQVIDVIETAGQVTLTENQILSAVRLRPGRIFDAETAAQDAQRIAALEGAESAYYRTEPVNGRIKLTYVVVEKNLIRSIIFTGNKNISDAKLIKEMGIKLGDYLDMAAVGAGRDAALELYHRRGYVWAAVELDLEALKAGQVKLTVDEGPKAKIVAVGFSGNKAFSGRELSKAIKTRTKKFWFWSSYYDAKQLEKDQARLIEVYQKYAYLDAQVRADVGFNQNRNRVKVSFVIDEGPAYKVETISITGGEFFDAAQLRDGLRLTEGGPFSPAWAELDAKKIRSRFLEQGFVEAQVDTQRIFLDGAKVRLEYKIRPGGRFRLGEVTITGNSVTHDNAIRRVLDEEEFTPGRWYNADIARGDGQGWLEKELRQTVYVESATIRPGGNAPDKRDAAVSVTEGKTGSIMLGAGIASDSGVIGQISLDQRNFDIADRPTSMQELITGKAFRGAGQRFRASFSPGTVQSSFLVGFTEPYLYDKPVALDLAGTGFMRGRESYDEQRIGGRIGLEKRYSDDWRRGISFRLENVDVSHLESDAPKEVLDVEGANLLAGARLYVGKDTTDDRFRPTRGYNFDAGYEQVGGDATFGILSGTQRWYTTLYEDLSEVKTVLETRIRGAAIAGDAPLFEKFYAGGSSSLRGFKYRGVSPRAANDDPLGSDWIVNGSAEVAVPLGGEVLSWLFFTDAAMIDTGSPRTSIGTGLQIMIPQWFGPVPMRFELAAPVTRESQDDTQVFSFSMGALF